MLVKCQVHDVVKSNKFADCGACKAFHAPAAGTKAFGALTLTSASKALAKALGRQHGKVCTESCRCSLFLKRILRDHNGAGLCV